MPKYRQVVHSLKGKINAVLDKSVFFERRVRQIFLARKKSLESNYKIHILCVNRTEYIDATINCLNSFWEFNPGFSACVWMDKKLSEYKFDMLKRLDRKSQIRFYSIPNESREWQWNKLQIITRELDQNSFFCDADTIWNDKLPNLKDVTFFLREYDLLQHTATRFAINKYRKELTSKCFMYNVSFVYLGKLAKNEQFAELTKKYYERVRSIKPNKYIGAGDVPAIKRMSEQIALSMACQNIYLRNRFKIRVSVLKHKDYVMDGEVLESFYLGATSGWE